MPGKSILGRCPACCPGQPCEGAWTILISGLTGCGTFPSALGFFPAGPLQPADNTIVNRAGTGTVGPPAYASCAAEDWCFVQPFPEDVWTTFYLGRSPGTATLCVVVMGGEGSQFPIFSGSGIPGAIIASDLTAAGCNPDPSLSFLAWGGNATVHVAY